jgi:hypothetical protein
LLFPTIYLAALLVRVPLFDRYFLPMLAPLTAILCSSVQPGALPKSARWIAVGMLLMLATYGVLGTRDYLERHRHRWQLLDSVLTEGVSSTRINGGFEFGGRFNFDREGTFINETYWVVDDEYLVTYADHVEGYEQLDWREYRRFLPPGSERVYLQRRVPPREGKRP